MKIDIDRVSTVTPETNIGELVLWHPETADLLYDIGMHCLGCPASGAETIRQAAEVHGVDAETLTKQLNDAIARSKQPAQTE